MITTNQNRPVGGPARRANLALQRVGSHIDSIQSYIQDALTRLECIEVESSEAREIAGRLREYSEELSVRRATIIADCRALRGMASGEWNQ